MLISIVRNLTINNKRSLFRFSLVNSLSALNNNKNNQNNTYATKSNPRERKRFYQNVTLTKTENNQYEINLDKRKLKTPSGSLVQLNDKRLAHLMALEWDSQQELIKQNTMHLTSIYNTSYDNPNKLTKDQLISQLSEYLQTDTILYFDSNSVEKLDRAQETKWRPIVDWFNLKFPSVNLKINYDLDVTTSQLDLSQFNEFLSKNFDLNSLVAFNYISECLKSVILTVALLERFIGTVDEACKLSLLEQEHQYDQWGKVEWYHDIHEQELRARVSAALLYIYLSHDSKYYLIKQN